MTPRRDDADDGTNNLLPLPLDKSLWEAVVKALRLSRRQIEILELTLRDAGDKQITATLGISPSTLKTQRQRIAGRTGARSRMQLAMRVLAVSHEVRPNGGRRPNG
jgi:DNA-binding CsgD family transcriptional regulator